MSEREESDQLPEEGPDPQVPEDDQSREPREEAERTAGAAEGGEEDEQEGQATGNPDAAG